MSIAWKILGFILIVSGIYGAGRYQGYQQKSKEDEVQIAQIVADNKAKEETLTNQIADLNTQRQKEKDDAQKQIAKRDSAIASGKLQLYVKTRSTCAEKPATPNAPATSGPDPSYAQLDPAFATSLTAITDDGDTQIRKLNACIATYETVRKMLNGSN